MKINISACGPKEWLDYKSEIVFGLYHAIKELGCEVEIMVNSFTNKGMNLIVGADFLPGTGWIEKMIAYKIDYIIYEVENYSKGVVNNRENFQAAEYMLLLENAKIIATPYKKNWLQFRSEGFSNVIYAPWGYYPEIEKNEFIKSENPRYKAVFFGLIKGDRVSKIKSITNLYGDSVKIINQLEPHSFRDYFISQSCWGLNLSYGINEEFVNPFRIYKMIANGTPVLSDNLFDLDGYTKHCITCSYSEILRKIAEWPQISVDDYKSIRDIRLSENLRDFI